MEHSLVQPVPSPWRARAFVAAAIAGLEAVVILVAAVVLVARPLSHRIRHDATAAAAKPAPVAKHPHRAKAAASDHAMLSRGETTVLVLNGNGQQGAAGTQAAQIRNLGYPVKGVGNAKRMNYGRTVVMYRPGYAGEARRLAHDARIALVGPLDGLSVSDLAGARIAIVVGSSS
jgi:hypothetical protein